MDNTFEIVANRRAMDECLDMMVRQDQMAGVDIDREQVQQSGASWAERDGARIGLVLCDGHAGVLVCPDDASQVDQMPLPPGRVLVVVPGTGGGSERLYAQAVEICAQRGLQLFVRDDQAWLARTGEFVVVSPLDGVPQAELYPVEMYDWGPVLSIALDGEPRLVPLDDIGGVQVVPGQPRMVTDGHGGIRMVPGR